MSVIKDAQTDCVCVLSAHSYFSLNTAQYIHIVEYSECFITDARMCWRSLLHQTLQTACSYRGTTDVVVNNNKTNIVFFIIKLMQKRYIPTSLFNYLFYLICILSFIYFSLGRSREFLI